MRYAFDPTTSWVAIRIVPAGSDASGSAAISVDGSSMFATETRSDAPTVAPETPPAGVTLTVAPVVIDGTTDGGVTVTVIVMSSPHATGQRSPASSGSP